MADTENTSHPRDELDLRAELARIDRDRAETQKLMEETRRLSAERSISGDRLIAEREKFYAERRQLDADAAKLERERWWFPWLQLITVAASGAAVAVIVGHWVH
jgi:hypothetical protein